MTSIVALTLVLGAAVGCGGETAVVDSSLVAPAPTAPQGSPEYGESIDDYTASAQRSDDAATTDQDTGDSADASEVFDDGIATLEWDDLVPPGFSGDEIWSRYEDELASLPDGSPEANAIYEQMRSEYDGGSQVNSQLDGTEIRLAGFVTPLSYEEEFISEFLLVPYFGACIHVPPPPPNQTVLVSLDEGMNIADTWGAVWVTGTLRVDSTETNLATAHYTLTGGATSAYESS